MKENNDNKPLIKIGVIGHVGYGKSKLNEAIEKILKEGNKKSKKEKTKDKSKLISKNEIFVDISHEEKLDI